MKLSRILVLCLFLSAAEANADSIKKVVIETTVGSDVPENLKDIFMNVLSSGLTNSGQFEVIANRQEYAAKIMGEIAAQEGGYVDDRQWINFGRASGAQMVIYPKIACFDNQYIITVELIDLESGVSKKTIKPLYATRSNVVEKALELSETIAGGGIAAERKLVTENDMRCSVIPGGYIESIDNNASSWSSASQKCEQRGPGWRLPTVSELSAIFRAAKANPRIYGTPFAATTYWTCEKRNNFSIYTLEYPSESNTYESSAAECKFRCVYQK